MNENQMNSKIEEAMSILAEECAEVIQALTKISRFGIDNYKPNKPLTNRQHLEEEIGDLLTMISILVAFNVIDMKSVDTARVAKIEKLKQWSTIFTEET